MKKIIFILLLSMGNIFPCDRSIVGSFSSANNKPQEDRKKIEWFNEDLTFLAVYDGHGGDRTVRILERDFHQNLQKALVCSPTIKKGFLKAFQDTEKAIVDNLLQERDYYKSYDMDGSTAVVACIKKTPEGKLLCVGHLGDSRLILEEDEKVAFATKDHDFQDSKELERVLKAQATLFKYVPVQNGVQIAYNPEWRIAGLNMSRSFGDLLAKGKLDATAFLKKIERSNQTEYRFELYPESDLKEELKIHPLPGQVIAEPSFSEHLLTEKNHWLILASDGFSDFVSNEEAVRFVITCNNSGKSLESTAQFLVRTAIEKGSKDNVTVIVYDLRK